MPALAPWVELELSPRIAQSRLHLAVRLEMLGQAVQGLQDQALQPLLGLEILKPGS